MPELKLLRSKYADNPPARFRLISSLFRRDEGSGPGDRAIEEEEQEEEEEMKTGRKEKKRKEGSVMAHAAIQP